MKYLLAVLAFSISLTSQAFYVQGHCQVNGLQANCSMKNPYNRALVCTAKAQGYTTSGIPLYSELYPTVIPVGGFAYVNIYTNAYQPFSYAQAAFYCQWY